MDRMVICKKCGKLFCDSENTEICPVCGEKLTVINVDENEFMYMDAQQEDQVRMEIQPLEKYDKIWWKKRIIYDQEFRARVRQKIQEYNATHPECPYCHERNTVKISSWVKAADTALLGIYGTKRFYQWHCNNCGSDF